MARTRPRTVVAATALAWSTAALDTVAGVAALSMALDESAVERAGGSAERLALIGSALLALGILTGAVAVLLPDGTPMVRAMVSGLLVTRLGTQGAAWGMLGWTALGTVAVSSVLAMVTLALLWTSHASRWFAGH
ncbi:hypothetical protein [Demequina salsinemoris]|uniref:hypothetical protein n=1 Tax=Demequina salsinemoris TaxID=577470 RepID=UPI0007806E11|nr:hypothetical protein [Demequina salsinemoris]